MADLHAIEQEMPEVGRGVGEGDRDATAISFESDSLQEMLDDAEEELERLSAILQGRARHPRGH
jgi:hypothetical protein